MITRWKNALALGSALSLCTVPAIPAAADITAGDRDTIVDAIADRIEENFFDRDRGARIAADLRDAEDGGIFDSAADESELAMALTSHLREEDHHFSVRYSPEASNRGSTDDRPARRAPDGRSDNFGFQDVSVLPGNVGYIDMTMFYPAGVGGDTAAAALDFIQHSDAVIFDMRNNRGGAPSMVQLLISHFLEPGEDTLINTFISSAQDYPSELRQLEYLPSRSRPDVPLYVLTSRRSGSAGEAFPYHLQALDRATIVGERTYGAGNPGRTFDAGDGFSVFVSTGSARNPVTGTNWEGTGVTPDVPVDETDALDEALKLAYAEIAARSDDATRIREMEWAIEAIEASDPQVDMRSFADIAGQYGPVRIDAEDGAILMHQGPGRTEQLIPLEDGYFLVRGRHDRRIRFEHDAGDAATALIIERPDATSTRLRRTEAR